MIDRTHGLSLTRQAEARGISRGAVYYVPRPVSTFDLALMRRLDAVHLDFPSLACGCCGACSEGNIRAWGVGASAP